MSTERTEFVRRHTRVLPVPLVPEIRLQTADDATALWEQTEAETTEAHLATQHLPPPFWAFPWAGGQALARFVLDHPDQVRDARVLDFASGSGLVGIAAALAGAARVEACDIDGYAIAAIALNAALNGISLSPRCEDIVGRDEGWDVVLAADVFYERETAAAVTAWLGRIAERGARVLLGDPGRSYFDSARCEPLARYAVPVIRSLEDADIKRAGVWRMDRRPGEGLPTSISPEVAVR